MVDEIEIYINPLANPDGTYYTGSHSVNGAIRGNAYGINLNRNYPDPEDGPHPDGNDWQTETVHFMNFAEEHNFVLGANFHGGEEVLNYPWDTWAKLAADNAWWVFICREIADTVHEHAPPTYLEGFNNGITNGYQWYSIWGGRWIFRCQAHWSFQGHISIPAYRRWPGRQKPSLSFVGLILGSAWYLRRCIIFITIRR